MSPGPTDPARILVVNAGSSSLKLRVLEGTDVVATRDLPAHRGSFEVADLDAFLRGASVDAIGHRIVHGGRTFTTPTLLDEDVLDRLRDLAELAPLHQTASIRGVEVVRNALPDVPAVGCFDTAFHAHMPAEATTYAVPIEWRERFAIRRYGFHGLSHAYASRRAAELVDAQPDAVRTVVCHLGAGASLCAVAGGRSVDTTMGFTPLEGLVMATRSGSVDPGLVLWLVTAAGLRPDGVADALEHDSGLLALGGSADMSEVVRRAERTDPAANLALDVYLHHLCAGIAAMTASLGGLDVLVFTGGVGEHVPQIRSRAARRLGFLGIGLDEDVNATTTSDGEVTSDGSRVRTVVTSAREDLEISAGVRMVVGRTS